MRRHAPIRLLVCAAMAGSAAFAAVALPGAIAAATPLTVTCTGLTGNATSQHISGCSGSGVTTGEATATGVQTTSTKTVKWSNGKTSVLSYKYADVKPDACKPPTGYTNYLEVQEIAPSKVSGGTATKLIGGALSGKVCIFKKGTTELVKNLGPLKL